MSNSPVTHPRGRLPARVYWVRRGVVLAVAALLVFGFAELLSSIGGSSPARAQLTGATSRHTTAPPTSGPAGPMGPTAFAPTTPLKGQDKTKHPSVAASPQTLAAPQGSCNAADITAVPVVRDAKGGKAVVIAVQLTGTSPACTFQASHKSLAVQISSGPDRIWSSQDCPGAVPTSSVVVRSAVAAVVPVTWSGHRSDGTCSATNAWAKPGYYHAAAAVIGSAPSDTQFKLGLPPTPVVTKTAHPKPTKGSPSSGTSPGSGSSQGGGNGTSCGGDIVAGSC